MPVPPTCLRRSGPFPLCRRAWPGTSPLGRMHARARLCRCMVLWPCPSHIGRNPVALVTTVLSIPLLSPSWTFGAFRRVVSHPSSSLPSRNSDQGPRLSYPNQTLGSPHLRCDTCCRATVPHRSPLFVPLLSARRRFCIAVVATSPVSCTCTHPRSQGPGFRAGTPGRPGTCTNMRERASTPPQNPLVLAVVSPISPRTTFCHPPSLLWSRTSRGLALVEPKPCSFWPSMWTHACPAHTHIPVHTHSHARLFPEAIRREDEPSWPP
jgi:hypothetical protein